MSAGVNGLWLAVQFLTTLPVWAGRYVYEARHWQTAVFWFPVVGTAVGGLVWLVGWGAQFVFDGWLAAVLAVTAWAVVTGGLHLDGLADCCDGLLAAATPERRLEIMRDSRVGAFAAVGLILFLGLKVGGMQAVLATGRGGAVLVAAALGRTLIVWVARQPMARRGGMGAVLGEQIRPFALLMVTLLPLGGVLWLGWRGVVALVTAVLLTVGIVYGARRQIGGVTGDVFGLTVELVELAVLLVLAA